MHMATICCQTNEYGILPRDQTRRPSHAPAVDSLKVAAAAVGVHAHFIVLLHQVTELLVKETSRELQCLD